IGLWTGELPPNARESSLPRLLIATPQLILNELTEGKIKLDGTSTIILDEAHRAVGNYAYVAIARVYFSQRKGAHVVGFTASPGDPRRLAELSTNLNAARILARSEEDASVSKYVEKINTHLVPVAMPPAMSEARTLLMNELNELLYSQSTREELHGLRPTFRSITERMFTLRKKAVASQDYELLNAVKTLATARRLLLMIERLDLGGPSLFLDFVASQTEQAGRSGSAKSLKQLLRTKRVLDAVELAKLQLRLDPPNPKLVELGRVLENEVAQKGKKAIVFVSYRSCADEVLNFLEKRGTNVKLLVGQRASGQSGGMSQREQRDVLEEFREGPAGVLIATQVGEEGLDIAGADVVVFYDNTPSAIRLVQRLGRTARFAPGDAYLLYFSGTSDERYLWIARKREKSMRALVKSLSTKIRSNGSSLSKFIEPPTESTSTVRIVVDERERSSQVVVELSNLGASLQFDTIEVGDYILSEDIAVERKTSKDFASSIVDGRLFEQAKQLKDTFLSPVLLLEGSDLLTESGLHPNALRGALISIMFDYGIPILQVPTPQEAAMYLFRIAQREQVEHKRFPRVREAKKPLSIKESQLYLLSGLPHVEKTTAGKLLKKFGSPLKVFNKSAAELMEVEGIGKIKANKIREVLTKEAEEKEDTNL
ncbi:MAG TPA: ERCC4 domain-containing protein, partial [Thermoproteota archaeon]|nr:ERCC4 domain-containing protein [Thermoproteota archaeon]